MTKKGKKIITKIPKSNIAVGPESNQQKLLLLLLTRKKILPTTKQVI